MIFFYIDESGTSLGDKSHPYFVLSAVAVNSTSSLAIDQFIHDLKSEIVPWAEPEDWELKGRVFRQGGRDSVFSNMNLPMRAPLLLQVAQRVSSLSEYFFAVRVLKHDLPAGISADPDLYRVATRAMLSALHDYLVQIDDYGLLFFDSRSTLSSAKQDRRVIDVFRAWLAAQRTACRFVELPWFGESSFYAGLQLADFIAYSIDFASQAQRERKTDFEAQLFFDVFDRIRRKVRIIDLP